MSQDFAARTKTARLERTQDEPVRPGQKSGNGDSPDPPTASRNLFVVPGEGGDGFHASIRGHLLDLADPSSGHALAPTPDDLLIVAIASELAWTARRLLRTHGLPDYVSVSAQWRTDGEPPSLADINVTVTVWRRTEAVTTALAAAFENSLLRSVGEPVVNISLEGVTR